MIARALIEGALDELSHSSQSRAFPIWIGVISAAATSTFTVPVEWLVLTATMMANGRWLAIAVSAAIGSAGASLIWYLVFHHFGWNILLSFYPEIRSTRVWSDVTRWLGEYGALALFAIMALPLPIPKLPALAFSGIYRLPVAEVFLAIAAGKLVKYGVYASVAAYFPHRLQRLKLIRWRRSLPDEVTK